MRSVLNLLVLAAAMVLLAEEWIWLRLKALARKLSAWPLVSAIERWLRGLSPWASVAVLALPLLVLLPFKLAAMWALGHGHAGLGIGVLIAAKLTGTAAGAYLVDLVSDRARELVLFDRFYRAVAGLLARCHAWVRRQPAYVRAARGVRRVKQFVRSRLARQTRWSRKIRAAKVLGRRYRR